MNEETKLTFKIYYLKNYILVHYITPQNYYNLYANGTTPHRQIDDYGHTTDYKIIDCVKDNYIVKCPYISSNFPILVNSNDLKEIDIKDCKQLFELTEYLLNFKPEVINNIKYLIRLALEVNDYNRS